MTTPISLFLHSTGTAPAMWASIPDAVTNGTRKLAPVHLGYPPRPLLAPGSHVTAADDAALVAAGLPDDGGDVHVYAHSYGAVVALKLLETAAGARVRSLFLYEPVMFGALLNDPTIDPALVADGRAEADQLRERHPWFLDDDRGGSEAWLEVFIDYWNRPGTWPRLPAPQRQWTLALGWKMYQEVRACFFDFDRFALPALAGKRTTLVVGDRSPRASQAMVRALVAANPDADITRVELAGAGHMAPITHAAKVGELAVAHAAARS